MISLGTKPLVLAQQWLNAETPQPPEAWTAGVTGWCLEIHDLIVSKYVAGRERDLEFASEAIKQGLVRDEILRERVSMLQVEKSIKELILKRISK